MGEVGETPPQGGRRNQHMPPSASPLGIPNLKPHSLRTDVGADFMPPMWSKNKNTLNQDYSLKQARVIVPSCAQQRQRKVRSGEMHFNNRPHKGAAQKEFTVKAYC